MPERCVVGGCSNMKDLDNGISLHRIPFFNDERTEAKRRRKTWVEFVHRKRAKWVPSKTSVICSVHLLPDDFATRYAVLPDLMGGIKRRLLEDDIGVVPVPSLYVKESSQPVASSSRSRRSQRMVSCLYCYTKHISKSI